MILSELYLYIIKHRIQITIFGLIGIATFVLNYSFVWLFYGFIALDYRLAVTLAYIITVIVHFTLNRIFTYKAEGYPLMGQWVKYAMMLVINYLITLSVCIITVEIFKLNPYFGIIFAAGITMFSSFLFMKYFVFYTQGVK